MQENKELYSERPGIVCEIKIKILHVIKDTSIWPGQSSLYHSLHIEELSVAPNNQAVVSVDPLVTVVLYQAKTLQQTLSEIAGLFVLVKGLSFLFRRYNEFRFNREMKKETGEEFREVFTYPNFRKSIERNQILEDRMIALED